ncbi:hypothetical protein Pelo_27 [Pelomyxa schiedti]|nr:hypothetical protein Pelo_27 [Pelomyxa schiedti]
MKVLLALVALFAVVNCCSDPYSDLVFYPYSAITATYTEYMYYHSDSYAGLCSSTTSSYPDAWFTFLPLVDGTLVVDTCGSSIDTVIEVQGGSTCDSRDCVTWNDDYCNWQSRVEFTVVAGDTYDVRVRPFSSSSTSSYFTLNYSFEPTGDSDSCPSDIYYLWDNEWQSFSLNTYIESGCWNSYYSYGKWFEYTPYEWDAHLHVCTSSYSNALTFVTDCTDCGYTYYSWYSGRSGCEYTIDIDLTGYYGETLDFLITGNYYDYITIDTYTDEPEWSSDFFYFPWWAVMLGFALFFLGLGLLLLLGAYCCHKRVMKRKYTVVPQMIEVPVVNGEEPTEKKSETPVKPSVPDVSSPNVPPPAYTAVYVPYNFPFQQMAVQVPAPVQLPPQLTVVPPNKS